MMAKHGVRVITRDYGTISTVAWMLCLLPMIFVLRLFNAAWFPGLGEWPGMEQD